MPDVQIRRGGGADTDVLAGLVPDPDRRFWRVRSAMDGLEQLLVAEADGQVVGAVSVRWAGACDPPNPWIYGGDVLEDWRSRGVGSLLWQAAHEECRSRGHELVSLDVDLENVAARRLYERLGYEVVGRHEHRWVARDRSGRVTGEGTADTWLMRCGLTPR
ncbi:GNAT family N-acetyltransferase [Pseudonocardia sp. DSM 110487]|nr:GNAT family N-acetyltransferase [Pseudonocardia sp. DSM 110487]